MLFLAFLWGGASVSAAEEAPKPEIIEKTSARQVRIAIDAGYTFLHVNDTAVSGGGLGVAGAFALSRRWAIGMGLDQYFTSSLNAFFTTISVNGSYALLGSMEREKHEFTANGRDFLSATPGNSGGLYAQLSLEEFFVNASEKLLPFPGVGLGLIYEFSSSQDFNFAIGGKLVRISNDLETAYPVQIFLRGSFWL